MPTFRKRPLLVTAERTFEEIDVETSIGVIRAEPGDWIITGAYGEKYPCKPDVFALAYEPSPDTVSPEVRSEWITFIKSISKLGLMRYFGEDDTELAKQLEKLWGDLSDTERSLAATYYWAAYV